MRNQVNALEKQLDRLKRIKSELEAQLADDALYQDGQKDQLKDLLWKQAELAKSIDETEEDWMTKADELEQATRSI